MIRELGAEAVSALSKTSTEYRHWFSTGLPPLDVILTGRVGKGMPSGRLVELFGNESVGKTTLGMSIIALAQRDNALGCLIDTESRFTSQRAKRLGVDVDGLICITEEYMEPILDAAKTVIVGSKKVPTVLFWDTVAGTPSKRERGAAAESAMGSHARALSKGLRIIARPLAQSNCLFLACNQLKEGALGDVFATQRKKDATLGGSAIKFHADMRVKLAYARKVYTSKDSDRRAIGFEISAEAVKNTNFIQETKCRLVFLYAHQGRFDPALSCLHTLDNWKQIKKTKGKYVFRDKSYTSAQWRMAYETDERFAQHVHDYIEYAYARQYLPDETEED